jgi:hypothetical protein
MCVADFCLHNQGLFCLDVVWLWSCEFELGKKHAKHQKDISSNTWIIQIWVNKPEKSKFSPAHRNANRLCDHGSEGVKCLCCCIGRQMLEVDSSARKGVDIGSIVSDNAAPTRKPLGATRNLDKCERPNSENFVDDPDVPPLLWWRWYERIYGAMKCRIVCVCLSA